MGRAEELLDEVAPATLDPEMEADPRIATLLERMEEAHDVLSDAYDACQRKAPDGTLLATPADYDKYAKAWKVYSEAEKALWDAKSSWKAQYARDLAARSFKRKDVIVDEMLAEYGNFGPQYRHLIDMLAGVAVKMEVHLALGGAEKEYMELAKLRLDLIGQLQKYTESTKTEQIKTEVNAVALKLAQVVEAYLKDQPTVLKNILGDWRLLVEGREE